ncbi:hypothetical protein T09_5735 [Trichinella sp. T9]|nr:hypothetical protein T09_5735 [Trichinella sp. T9]
MRYLTKLLVIKDCIIKRARFASVAIVPSKIVSLCNSFAISRQIRVSMTKFWKVPWQTNLNLLNKWLLQFACAYVNTQESSPSGTPLKRLQDAPGFRPRLCPRANKNLHIPAGYAQGTLLHNICPQGGYASGDF